MSFTPIVPATGNVGWSFLKASRADQQEAFNTSTPIKNSTEYFSENIGRIQSAEELVADRRLLSVALGAFGLDEDINNKFFIQKVLEEGSLDDEAFANRLSDKRYFALAEAFGFHLSPPNTVLSDFAQDIVSQYQARQFEVGVGNQDENLRLALGLSRDLGELAAQGFEEDTAWFNIMGTPPMRRVFELALGLPSEFAAIDIDQQLSEFKERAEAMLGVSNPAEFTDPEVQEKIIRTFLLRADLDANSGASSRGSVALSLLQSIAPIA